MGLTGIGWGMGVLDSRCDFCSIFSLRAVWGGGIVLSRYQLGVWEYDKVVWRQGRLIRGLWALEMLLHHGVLGG